MIDQPAGTGLSYTDRDECYAATEGLASDQLHAGVRLFMKTYPQYATNPLFISSESYGGHCKYLSGMHVVSSSQPFVFLLLLFLQMYQSSPREFSPATKLAASALPQSTCRAFSSGLLDIQENHTKKCSDLYTVYVMSIYCAGRLGESPSSE